MTRDESWGVAAPVSTDRGVALTSRAEGGAPLTALFDTEFPRLYSFVLARCGSTATAEDIAAETFADAARAVQRGRGEEVDRSWLLMVARRRLIDHWRSDERHRRRVQRFRLQRQQPEARDSIEDEQVLGALGSLPKRQRAALTLRYLDEYSVSEIADTLQVSYRAAESLLSRARAGFAKVYGEFDG